MHLHKWKRKNISDTVRNTSGSKDDSSHLPTLKKRKASKKARKDHSRSANRKPTEKSPRNPQDWEVRPVREGSGGSKISHIVDRIKRNLMDVMAIKDRMEANQALPTGYLNFDSPPELRKYVAEENGPAAVHAILKRYNAYRHQNFGMIDRVSRPVEPPKETRVTAKQVFPLMQDPFQSFTHESMMVPVEQLPFDIGKPINNTRGTVACAVTLYQRVKSDPERYLDSLHISLLGVPTDDLHRVYQLIRHDRK